MSFQVSGLFLAEENTLYVNINFVINGVLVTKDKKDHFIFLSSNFACVQTLFATFQVITSANQTYRYHSFWHIVGLINCLSVPILLHFVLSVTVLTTAI